MQLLLLKNNAPKTDVLETYLRSCGNFDLASTKDPDHIACAQPHLVLWDATQNSISAFQSAQPLRHNPNTKNTSILFLTESKMRSPLFLSDCWIHPIVELTTLIDKLTRINCAVLNSTLNVVLITQSQQTAQCVKKELAAMPCTVWEDPNQAQDPSTDIIITDAPLLLEQQLQTPVFYINSNQGKICGFYNNAVESFCSKIRILLKNL